MQSNVIVNYSRQETSSILNFKKSEKKMVTNRQTDRQKDRMYNS